MKRLANLVWTSVAGLTFAACASPADEPQPLFTSGDPTSIRLATELGLRALQQDPALMAGVAQVNARSVEIDVLGRAHAHIAQAVDGVPVFGAEAIVHLDAEGRLDGVTDRFARDLAVDARPAIDRSAAVSTAVAASARAPEQLTTAADLQILRRTGKDRLTYRVQLDYVQGGEHFRPVVFVDAKDGSVVWSYDNLQTARDREVHNLNHSTTLPGPVSRVEGGATTGDVDIDTNYDRLGSVYDCYSALFGRNSYDNAGAKLISSVHYSTNYVNAFWNGTQMVYGDGDNVNSRSLAISMDVTAHELTHAVTERTSTRASRAASTRRCPTSSATSASGIATTTAT
jgi:Zn-dependent metalloprotease